MGFQAISISSGEHWLCKEVIEKLKTNTLFSDVVLTQESAMQSVKEASLSMSGTWKMVAVCKGDIETPVYEQKLMCAEDQYKVIGISTAHLTMDDKSLLSHLAQRDDTSMCMERDTGFFIKLYDELTCYEESTYSENILNIVKLAIEAGFRMIEFDGDASEMRNLPLFE